MHKNITEILKNIIMSIAKIKKRFSKHTQKKKEEYKKFSCDTDYKKIYNQWLYAIYKNFWYKKLRLCIKYSIVILLIPYVNLQEIFEYILFTHTNLFIL